ncbi:hypothetical protein L218DRAFT_1076436 [Marasmius fiardii PR-910]|nr:hypothetical protein L218DRAFT_1076436 [Marasmius fiardii PR-910]
MTPKSITLATALAALLPVTTLAQEPTFYSGTRSTQHNGLEKRGISGKIATDGLRYRVCPRTSSDCPAQGEFSGIGVSIDILCYSTANTTVVEEDPGWAQLTNGYWVAMAFGEYISWSSPIPYCIDP